MSYSYILDLIDAQLDRLQQARNLLVSSPAPAEKLFKPKAQHARPPAGTTKSNELTQPIQQPAALPELPVTIVSRKVPPARRNGRQNKPRGKGSIPRALGFAPVSGALSSALGSALGGVVPTGPVYVSAEQIRKSQAPKEAGEGTSFAASTDSSEILTAAMLSQRWLNGSGV